MEKTEEEREAERKKRTLLLLAGGAASLLLPLLGVLYLHMTDSTISRPAGSAGDVFERRDSAAAPDASLPVQPPMAPSTPGQSSLNMIVGGGDYYPAGASAATAMQQAQAQAGQPVTQSAGMQGRAQASAMPGGTALSSLTPRSMPAAQAQAQASQNWQQPHLQQNQYSVKFGVFGTQPKPPAPAGTAQAGQHGQAQGAAVPQGMRAAAAQGVPQGMPQGMGQGMPAGMPQGMGQAMPAGMPQGMPQGMGMGQGMPAGMPQGMPQGAAGQGVPDISGMLKNLPAGAAGPGSTMPAGTPNVSSMLQNIPGLGGTSPQQN